ncbi:MAG: phosphoribosylglycinamide synthetase C domain-containing protein, partial [Gemmatimonadales bacterium]
VLALVIDIVLLPTLHELARRGGGYRGVLYAGVMLHPDGTPNVIEFNCRLGDPETQAVIPLVHAGLLPLLDAAARGESLPNIAGRDGAAVTTILAAAGYPDAPVKGAVITLPGDLPGDVTIYHAGTSRLPDDTLVVSGGRVLAVTAVAATFAAAQAASRSTALRVTFDGKQMRSDIGWREAARLAPHRRQGRST